MTFEANGRDIKITDVWDNKGFKTVTNGNGIYRTDTDRIYWQGKLLNGKPDGKWKSKQVSDNSDITSETFKNGVFQKGMALSEYTDESRMVLVFPSILPFITAESFQLSQIACDGVKPKEIVNAQAGKGYAKLDYAINKVMWNYTYELSKYTDIKTYNDDIVLLGEVNEHGSLINLKTIKAVDVYRVPGLIDGLRTGLYIIPATVDGKPVKQGFKITIKIYGGVYSYSYQFLPIESAN